MLGAFHIFWCSALFVPDFTLVESLFFPRDRLLADVKNHSLGLCDWGLTPLTSKDELKPKDEFSSATE